MVRLQNAIIVSKEVVGIYNQRIMFEGEEEYKKKFVLYCMNSKKDAGLMQQTETSFEFLHRDKESIISFATKIADEIKVPLVIM